MAMECYEQIIFGFGCFAAVLLAPKTIAYLLHIMTRCCRRDLLKPQQNDWAIITGATDGIGLEYARQLAQKGYNLLLISRTESKLLKVRKEILETTEVDIEVHSADFTKTDIYPGISEKISSLEGRISVLVNNVGTMETIPYEFAAHPDENVNSNMLICNTLSVLKMCEITLKIMKSQRHGVIINLSSALALSPVPYFTTYSATKVFVSSLSDTLADEYKEYGITIQNVIPNQVTTNMSKDVHIDAIAVTSKSFVQYALKAVGKERETSAHPKHKFLAGVSRFILWWLPEAITSPMRMSVAKSTRETALKKHNNNAQTM